MNKYSLGTKKLWLSVKLVTKALMKVIWIFLPGYVAELCHLNAFSMTSMKWYIHASFEVDTFVI